MKEQLIEYRVDEVEKTQKEHEDRLDRHDDILTMGRGALLIIVPVGTFIGFLFSKFSIATIIKAMGH